MVLGCAKKFVPVASLAAWASRPRRHRSVSPELVIGRVLRAGAIVGAPDRDCLQRSLLLYRELSRVGAPATLAIGMKRHHDRLAGHAWVLLDGQVVAESAEDVAGFVPVLTFDGRQPSSRRLHA